MPPSRFELTTPGLWDQRVANELNVTQDALAKKLVVSWNNSMRCLRINSNSKLNLNVFFLLTDFQNWFLTKCIRV